VSLTAGFLITRVSNKDGEARNVGKELTTQLLSQPKAWITSSTAILAFGFLPGMPSTVFLVLAMVTFFIGFKETRKQNKPQENLSQQEVPELREFVIVRPFVIRIASHVTSIENARRIVNIAREVRNGLVLRYALVTPPIEVEYGVTLLDADFEFCRDEVRVFAMRLTPDWYMAECDTQLLLDAGLDALATEVGAQHIKHRWHWFALETVPSLNAKEIFVQSFWQFIEHRFYATLLKAGPKYVGIEQAQKIVRWLTASYPDLGKELERVISTSKLAEVLQRLLEERISIRNLLRISEALIEWGQRERDVGILCECVRSALAREICNAHATSNQLHAFMLDAELEMAIRGAIRQTSYGDFLALSQDDTDAVLDDFGLQLEALSMQNRPIILCQQDVRPQVRRMFKDRFDDISILSVTEVQPDYKVKVLGVINCFVSSNSD
jgi:type III secretion protein V